MTSTHEPPVSRTGSTGLRACVLFASFFLLAGAGLLYGKPISIDIASPPPEQVDFKHLWGITLHNPTSDTVSVSLRVEAREVAAGVVFTTSTQKIVLAPGDHRLAPRDVKLTDEWWKKGYEAFTRPGHLPEGDFTYTVSLVPAMMQAALFFRIRIPKPVELIWPSNAAVVGDSQPVFAWKPPVVSGPPGAYRYFLRVVEVARGQNAAAALQRNPSVFDGRGLSATVCRIPVQAGRFVPGKTYAWRAAAMDPARESVDTTRTRSQASLFLYRPDMAKADTTTAFAYQPAGTSVTGNASLVVTSGVPEAGLCLMEYSLGSDSAPREWHVIGCFPKIEDRFVGLWASDSAVLRAGKAFPCPCVVRATVLDPQGRRGEALLPLAINQPPPPTRKGCGCGH